MLVGTETLNPCQAVEGDHVKNAFLMELSFKSKVRVRLIEGVLNYSKLLNYFLFLNQNNFDFKKAILCVNSSNDNHINTLCKWNNCCR